MALYDTLQTAIASAQKSGSADELGTLRLLKNVIDMKVKDGAELTDELVGGCALAEIKKRQEAAKLYRQGGSDDKADAEELEITLIEAYAPVQMSDDELKVFVDRIIADSGITEMSQMGQLMTAIRAEAGQGVDMGRVSQLVRERLS